MKYLHLKFESATLKHADIAKAREGMLGVCSLTDINNTDWSCPIGLDQVSNMLHVMFGLPPKAVNRYTVFKRNKDIYELAKGAYIKYDNYSEDDVKFMNGLEFFQSAKPNYNAHSKVTTYIDGKDMDGFYTWNYFERRFKGKEELLDKIMNFFNEALKEETGGGDVREYYYFPEFVERFHNHLDDEYVQEFFEEELYMDGEFYGRNKPLNKAFIDILNNEYKKDDYKGGSRNTEYSGPTPLLYTKGTGNKLTLNGEIIVPIENDDYVDFLEKYGTLPTLLDGGVVTVLGIRKKPPYIGFEDDFIPLSKVKKWRKSLK